MSKDLPPELTPTAVCRGGGHERCCGFHSAEKPYAPCGCSCHTDNPNPSERDVATILIQGWRDKFREEQARSRALEERVRELEEDKATIREDAWQTIGELRKRVRELEAMQRDWLHCCECSADIVGGEDHAKDCQRRTAARIALDIKRFRAQALAAMRCWNSGDENCVGGADDAGHTTPEQCLDAAMEQEGEQCDGARRGSKPTPEGRLGVEASPGSTPGSPATPSGMSVDEALAQACDLCEADAHASFAPHDNCPQCATLRALREAWPAIERWGVETTGVKVRANALAAIRSLANPERKP